MGRAWWGATYWLASRINEAQFRISISTVARNAADWYPHGADTNPAYPHCVVETVTRPIGTGYTSTYSRRHCDLPVAAAPPVFAIGDSHAIGYAGLYKEYVMETGAPVSVYNDGGCPFLSLKPEEESEKCRADAKAALEDMLGRIRPGDVVFLSSLRLPRLCDQWIRFSDSQAKEMFFSGWAAARARAVTAAEGVLRQFHAKGAYVVLEAPTPVFRSPTFRCVETYNRTNPICRDGTEIDRKEVEQLREPILSAFGHLASVVPNVGIWDPFPVLCPPGPVCSAFSRDGRPLFFDGDHVSGYGNHMLLPSFRAFVSGNRSDFGNAPNTDCPQGICQPIRVFEGNHPADFRRPGHWPPGSPPEST
ncbi:hypothetical protein CCP4SC76_5240027 [Gammaproteobacteria bacterium]